MNSKNRTTSTLMKRNLFIMNLRVLGYQENDHWAAHCLETDLVGYGKTFKRALADLFDLTEMQISFALFKNQPSLLDCPAPAHIIETYLWLCRSFLQQYTTKEKSLEKNYQIASLPLPEKPKRVEFSLASA